MMFDRHHLCCSAGSACRTGSLEASHVLRAMSLPSERTRGSMRFSFGRFNADADLDKALEIIPEVIAKLRALSPANPAREPAAV
jgi:cysteine desulfurase